MLWDASTIKGYEVEASDGPVGTVSDWLFDDVGWAVRWLVVDVGHWLTGRKVLLPRAALGQPDRQQRRLPVRLTMQQVKDGPDVDTDQPVSRQIEANVDKYYSWVPYPIGSDGPLSNAIAQPFVEPLLFSETRPFGPPSEDVEPDAPGDPHLRSIAVVTGYHVHATDGEIGHIENFLVDDALWDIRYLIIDTRNWWPGEHVLLSPYAVKEISWAEHQIHIGEMREQVKASPPWNPLDLIDQDYEKQLHSHYQWPGYGW